MLFGFVLPIERRTDGLVLASTRKAAPLALQATILSVWLLLPPSMVLCLPPITNPHRERSPQPRNCMTKAKRFTSSATGPRHTSPRDKPHCAPLAPINSIRNRDTPREISPRQPAQNQRKTRGQDNLKTMFQPHKSRELSAQP